MHRIGWFSTARDKAALDLFEAVVNAIRSGEINSHIAYVFSNGDPERNQWLARLSERAAQIGVPSIILPSHSHRPRLREAGKEDPELMNEWRTSYDQLVMQRLEQYPVDVVVLAGYMLIVGHEMCERYPMINLHPALPGGPAGSWQDVIRQLIETKARETGVTVHLVTKELDAGPPLTFCRFSLWNGKFKSLWREFELALNTSRIEHTRLFRQIRKHEAEREIPLLILTLRKLSRGELTVERHQVLHCGAEIPGGLDLTDEVEARVTEDSGNEGHCGL